MDTAGKPGDAEDPPDLISSYPEKVRGVFANHTFPPQKRTSSSVSEEPLGLAWPAGAGLAWRAATWRGPLPLGSFRWDNGLMKDARVTLPVPVVDRAFDLLVADQEISDAVLGQTLLDEFSDLAASLGDGVREVLAEVMS